MILSFLKIELSCLRHFLFDGAKVWRKNQNAIISSEKRQDL